MFGRSLLVYFVSFLALLGTALAVPGTLYRMTPDPPATAKQNGGLIAHNPDGTGSVIDHAENTLGNDDPWVSSTEDLAFAQSGATYPGYAYVYYIDSSKLTTEVVEVAAEFANAGRPNPHPAEKEWSIKREIPWNAIIKWDRFFRSKYKDTITREDFDNGKGGSKARSIRTFFA
jgi:hypothetical protein